ncbi:MAG: type II toxin-antitoxin system RelE/ParE family toxin [Acidobacteriia bacterium]|nr:type II toxin-antitoxin system RelE/ParE family toxin [Terriglobia bacterium]
MRKRRKQPSPAAPLPEEGRSKPPFELRYTPDAAAEIKALDGSVRNQLRKVLEKKLAVDPEGYGLPLRGSLAGYWKHQFGSHRVVYRIYRQHIVVVVCSVGARKQGDAEDIYRQLESVAKTGRLAEQLAAVLRNILPVKK